PAPIASFTMLKLAYRSASSFFRRSRKKYAATSAGTIRRSQSISGHRNFMASSQVLWQASARRQLAAPLAQIGEPQNGIDDLMALRKMGQRLGPARRANEIGDDENEGSSLHDPKSSLQKIAQVRRGRTGTLGPRKHSVEDVERMAPAAPRRNHRIYTVTIEQ